MVAYEELCTERQATMAGLGPVPWSRIVQYADRYGMNERMLKTVVRSLDATEAEYRKTDLEKVKAKGASRKASTDPLADE